jgi:anti-sigma B factor antagonist
VILKFPIATLPITDQVSIVHCRGRLLDRDRTAALSEEIRALPPQTRQLLLEFPDLERINGAGLRGLALLSLHCQARACRVKPAAPQAGIRQVLELSHLSSVFEIYPTLEELLSCRRPVPPKGVPSRQ